MKRFYLLMAILGTVIPWIFFTRFIGVEGFDIPLFARSLFVNGAAAGFSADLLLSLLTFWVWSFADSRKKGVNLWWLVIPAGLTVGLSLAMPLYLYLRTESQPAMVPATA